MIYVSKGGRDFTDNELRAAQKMNRDDNRSRNFRWVVAGLTILCLSICRIKNKYGKSKVEKHQEGIEKKKKTTKKKDGDVVK